MKRLSAWAAFLGSVALLAVFVVLLVEAPDRPGVAGPLLVYCGAGIRVPVEAAAKEYEKAYGIRVDIDPGPSQVLLAKAEATKRGDLLLPGDDRFLRMAREKGLADESIPLARVRPALAVKKGNPLGLRGLEDLGSGRVRLAFPNPEAAAAGALVKEALQARGAWDAFSRNITVSKPTVNEVANDLKLGTVDAGFVWDATVRQYPELEAVTLPELEGKIALLSAGVLRSSRNPAAAFRFARFLAARDRGQKEFERAGFEPAGGDPWEEKCELLLYAGAMLRPAIDPTIALFERREGVEVVRVWNGCGILVGQMKTGARPDLYFSCDESFMDQVKDLFEAPREVSINQLVILVPKANPHGIKTLRDLGKPGLRVGIGHERQCALGQLTQTTLVQEGLQGEIMKNVFERGVQAPTGDLLVNMLRTGSLDAIVAYVSNAARAGDELRAFAIDVPCALAVQPVAVGKESRRRQLASRLIDALVTPASRERFKAEGFRWKGTP